jgi:hypothetical protein
VSKGGNHSGRQNKHLTTKDIKGFHKLLVGGRGDRRHRGRR